jgi:hypothetical protein
MSWESAPQDGHTLLITPDMQVEAVEAGKSYFTPAIAEEQYESGMIGRHARAKVYECQNLITHTVGPLGGTPQVDGATQTGATINTKGWTAAAAARLKKGDIIQFAGVKHYNNLSGQSSGALRNFTVTADFSSAADGTGAISISPAIVTSGPYQNVTGSPADSAAITIFGHASDHANKVTPQGLRYHRDAFLFGSFDQPLPSNKEVAVMKTDPQTTLRLRLIKDWDTKANEQLIRFDVVWAFGVAYPELAARMLS